MKPKLPRSLFSLVNKQVNTLEFSRGNLKRGPIETQQITPEEAKQTMSHKVEKLSCTWTFWQDKWGVAPDGEKKQFLSHLGDSENVIDFYSLLNRHGTYTIPLNSSLHIFRKHVRPEWEDKHNINGGHLRFFPNIQAGETPDVGSKRLSCLWIDVVRSLIGEHLPCCDQIVGVGYTNKSHRPIISVWTSTTDAQVIAAIRNAVFQLFATGATTFFTAKFYSNKGLARNDGGNCKSEEVTWHRRVKSAPEVFVTVGDEEEDISSQGSVHSTEECCNELKKNVSVDCKDSTAVTSASSREESSGQFGNQRRDRKRSDAVAGPDTAAEGETSSPTSLLARRGLTALGQANASHSRSRTESNAPEAFAAQPLKPCAPNTGDESLPSSNQFFIGPTPIKDWTQDWSPSTFHAAQARASGIPLGGGAPSASAPARQSGPRAVGATPTAASGGSLPEELALKLKGPSLPPLPVAPSPSAVAAKKPVVLDPNQISDRKPFVHNNVVYPSKINRRDYRAIVFHREGMPPLPVHEGSFAAPEGTPDGEIEDEVYEMLKLKYLEKPLDV